MTAPIYRENACSPLSKEVEKLEALCVQFREFTPPELYDQLNEALDALRVAARATIPITKGSMRWGYGIDKAKKAVACDTAIAIIRQIKAFKAW